LELSLGFAEVSGLLVWSVALGACVSGCAAGADWSGAVVLCEDDGGIVGGVCGVCWPIPCANAIPLPSANIKASLLIFFVMCVSL
jgi:hypothetical protein